MEMPAPAARPAGEEKDVAAAHGGADLRLHFTVGELRHGELTVDVGVIGPLGEPGILVQGAAHLAAVARERPRGEKLESAAHGRNLTEIAPAVHAGAHPGGKW